MTFNPFEITVISFSIAFFILALVSRFSGWEYLGKKFSTLIIPRGEKFKNVFLTMGKPKFPMAYKGCVTVIVSENGIHLSVLYFLRFKTPPIFIPWSEIELVQETNLSNTVKNTITLKEHWPIITVRGRVGIAIKTMFYKKKLNKKNS